MSLQLMSSLLLPLPLLLLRCVTDITRTLPPHLVLDTLVVVVVLLLVD